MVPPVKVQSVSFYTSRCVGIHRCEEVATPTPPVGLPRVTIVASRATTAGAMLATNRYSSQNWMSVEVAGLLRQSRCKVSSGTYTSRVDDLALYSKPALGNPAL